MTGTLIDLFFSFRGRASRQEWLLGSATIVIAAALGVYLFNDASFDESTNAAPEIPTMAAVFWFIVCLMAFWAVSVKRLADAGRSRWIAAAVCLLSLLLFLGWTSGYFPAALSASADALIFWVLVGGFIPALVLCATARRKS
jgi:uncharacterized membrane protein YhaH (DUF805 family)